MKLTLPKFDNKWIESLHGSSKEYSVMYYLFKTGRSARNITMIYVKNLTNSELINDAVCFSKIRHGIKREYNALAYILTDINLKAMKFLSTKEVRRWLRLCKQYYLIGDDVSIKFGTKHPYVIIRFDNYTKNQLYTYLCSIRYLVEWPHYVRAVLTLYDSGLPFYSAFVAASRLVINNSVHHILDVIRRYGERWNIYSLFDVGFNLRSVINLKLFVSDFSEYDKQNVYDGEFRCSTMLTHLKGTNNFDTYVQLKELYTKELKALVNADNLIEMKKYYEEYSKNKKKYSFVLPADNSIRKKEASNA